MRLQSTMGISGRLKAGAMLLSAGLLAMALLTHLQLLRVTETHRRMAEDRVLQLTCMAEWELNVTRAPFQFRHAMLVRTPQEQEASLQDISVKRALIKDWVKEHGQRLFTELGRKPFENRPSSLADVWQAGEATLVLIKAGKPDQAFAHLVDNTIPARKHATPCSRNSTTRSANSATASAKTSSMLRPRSRPP
jgi:hypothetical protein